jgi:predicted Ser/Thr protein kinase
MFSSSPASTVLAKFARFDWEIGYLKNETTAYQWIEGQDIGPRFLGHLTEDGGRRVIGFLIERIWDARHAGPDDLEGCQRVLSRLHGLRIRHGDINRFNFLATPDRTALIDFDTARRCEDQDALCDEMEDVAARLLDPSTLGGGGLL